MRAGISFIQTLNTLDAATYLPELWDVAGFLQRHRTRDLKDIEAVLTNRSPRTADFRNSEPAQNSASSPFTWTNSRTGEAVQQPAQGSGFPPVRPARLTERPTGRAAPRLLSRSPQKSGPQALSRTFKMASQPILHAQAVTGTAVMLRCRSSAVGPPAKGFKIAHKGRIPQPPTQSRCPRLLHAQTSRRQHDRKVLATQSRTTAPVKRALRGHLRAETAALSSDPGARDAGFSRRHVAFHQG
eukprot:scaffold301_cov243-Pinguiococcus_pyrenoidosus.AAC.97